MGPRRVGVLCKAGRASIAGERMEASQSQELAMRTPEDTDGYFFIDRFTK